MPALVALAGLAGCVAEPVAYAPPPRAEMAVVVEAPPPLPYYEQPICPGDGYLWTPGYWGRGGYGYFWVPGAWVLPPRVGVVWTPGYWAATNGGFFFHEGYWGTRVGFYGGVNYGGGYTGRGFAGGRWVNNRFQYNTAVTNVNVTNVHNVYRETVVNNVTVSNVTNVTNNVSYSGGPGGARAVPTADERAAERLEHIRATPQQTSHEQESAANPTQLDTHNPGRAPMPRAATNESPATSPPQQERRQATKPTREKPKRHPGNDKDKDRPDREQDNR